MDVRICGPNLRDQSKGQYHVHANGCGDLRKYGPEYRGKDGLGGDFSGNHGLLVENATIVKVVEAVYDNGILDESIADHLFDEGLGTSATDQQYSATRKQIIGQYVGEFWFAPCCGGLPYSDEPEAPEATEGEIVHPVYECWVVGDRDSFVKFSPATGPDDSIEEVVKWVRERLLNPAGARHISIGLHTSDEYTSAGDARDPRD
jgi:hypothetical protein